MQQWKALLDKPVPAAPGPPPPVPQVITVQVPRKLTADEMLASVDESVLEALLAAKSRAREVAFHHLLTTLAATRNGKPAPVLPPHTQRSPESFRGYAGLNDSNPFRMDGPGN